MATNPLFREGFYFFSNLYDDSLISEFYPKITQETWSAAMSSQKALATMGLRSSGDFNYFKGNMLDLVVNSRFNSRYGFAEKTRSVKLTNFALPVRDERLLIRTYMKEEQQCMKIPQMDFLIRTDIFTKSLSVLFGDNIILNATFLVDSQRNVYLVLPYRYKSPVTDESTWSDADFANIDSYLNKWSSESSELVTFKPHITLWVIPDDQDVVIRLSPSDSNKTYPLDRSTETVVSGTTHIRLKFDTRTTYDNYIGNKKCTLANSSSGDWDLYILDGFGGNMFHSINADIYSAAYYSESNWDINGTFDIVYSEYFNNLHTGGNYPGYYCYMMKRGNRRRTQKITNTTAVDAMIKDLLPQNPPSYKNPPSPYNLNVYAYDAANDHKLYRLDSATLEPICFEAAYDFSNINPDNEPIIIEINSYMAAETNQIMHNSMISAMNLEVKYGGPFSAILMREADVAEIGDPSPGRNFAPQAQLSSIEDYLESDYKAGSEYTSGDDFRGYFLDKIIKTIKSDPGLTHDYFEFIASKDPLVYTVSGTPWDFGFNTMLTGNSRYPANATGTNPTVYNTAGYMEDPDAQPIEFQEKHSFIKVNSNNEKVYVKFFLSGLHIVPTAHTFNGVDNFFFFPVTQISNGIMKIINWAGSSSSILDDIKPITMDIYPHSFASYEEALKESMVIPVSNQEFKLFNDQQARRYIRLIDLSYTVDGTIHTNVLDDFNVYLAIDIYRIKTSNGYRYFRMRSDQSLDGIIPLIEGLYPGSSIKEYSIEYLSVNVAVQEMLELGLITEDETYKLLCKSLPLKDLYFQIKPNSSLIGAECTWQMENYAATLEFTGERVIPDSDPGYAGVVSWNSTELDGVIGKYHLGDFINGAERWILYRSGRLEPNFKIHYYDNNTLHLSISSRSILTTSSNLFKLIHLPTPVSIDRGEYADRLSYMRQQPVTRVGRPMTVYQLWPSGVSPADTGFIVLDRLMEDSQAPLGSNGNDIYLDNYHLSTGGGARLNKPNTPTYADRAAFYKPIDASETNANISYPPSIVRTINGLPIITGQGIQPSSPFNFYIGPEKNELVGVTLWMENPEDLFSIRYLDNGFIAIGKFKGGTVCHHSQILGGLPGREESMQLPNIIDHDFDVLYWKIFACIDGYFFAISSNPRNTPLSYQYPNMQAIFTHSSNGIDWVYFDPRVQMNRNLPTLDVGCEWNSFGFYGNRMLVGSDRSILTAFSSNSGSSWSAALNDNARKTVIVGMRDGNFIAVDGISVQIGKYYSSSGFMWDDSVYTLPYGSPMLVNLVDKGDLLYGYPIDHTDLFTSPNGKYWGKVYLDPNIDHMDDRFIIANDFEFSVATQGARTPRLRYAKLNIEQNSWSLDFPEKYFLDRYIADSEGFLDITENQHYPVPIISGKTLANTNHTITINFTRNYRRP